MLWLLSCPLCGQDWRPLGFSAGVGVGGMNCMTDLGGPRSSGDGYYLNEINWRNTKPAASLFATVHFRNIGGLRLEGTIGSVQAYDSILAGAQHPQALSRYHRNLSVKSAISELQLVGEFYFLDWFRGGQTLTVSPYFAAGAGAFAFNPKTWYGDKWVELQPLRTEGQGFAEYPERKPYSLTALNLSFGGGLSYSTSRMNYKIEILHRRLNTDYLDDVSTTYIDQKLFITYLPPGDAELAQALYKRSRIPTPDGAERGNRKSDAYLTLMFKIGYLFGGAGSGGSTKKMKCWMER